MAEHAILSASGSHRWLACTPSARLEEQFPDEQSGYAAEGSLAHEIAELRLRYLLGELKKPQYTKNLKKLCKNPLYQKEMLDYVETYVELAMERINTARAHTPDAVVLVEQRLDFSTWVPDGFGTGDLVIIADGILEIIDLKYGKGVPVNADHNTQMMLYSLGAIFQFEMLYDIETIRMTICQPRLNSISTFELPVDELLSWGETFVQPRAALAISGEGEFQAGDHCRFCRARATCRARAEANLELTKLEFRKPALLTNDEIAEVLAKAEELQAWVSDIKSYALDQAENHGVKFPGWKLVEGRSNRVYVDVDAVAQTLLSAGYTEDSIYKKTILGITDMEKTLGKKLFNELLGDLVIKPQGKPTLVPESDKRPELNSIQSAIDDFSDCPF